MLRRFVFHTCLVVCFGVIGIQSYGQTPIVDSLLTVLNDQPQDTNRVRTLLHLASQSLRTSPQQAQSYTEEARDLAINLADSSGAYKSWHVLGAIFHAQSNYPAALKAYGEAIVYSNQLGRKKWTASTINNMGNSYQVMGRLDSAIQYHEKALAIRESIEDSSGMADSYNNMANIYKGQGDIEKAQQGYRKAQAIYEAQHNETGIAQCLNNIGTIYIDRGNYPVGMDYQLKALQIYERLGNTYNMLFGYNNIAFVYDLMNQDSLSRIYILKTMELAKEMNARQMLGRALLFLGNLNNKEEKFEAGKARLLEALAVGEEIQDQVTVANAHQYLSDYYADQDDPKLALDHAEKALTLWENMGYTFGAVMAKTRIARDMLALDRLQEAESFALNGFQGAETLGAQQAIRDAAHVLAKTYEKRGRFKDAFHYQRILTNYQDSLKNDEKTREVARLEMQYEVDKQAQERALQEEKAALEQEITENRQRAIRNLLIIGVLFMAILAFVLYRGRQRAKKVNTLLRHKNLEIAGKNVQLEELNRIKNKLFSVISHDLRSPLSTLMGLLTMLKEGVISPDHLQRLSAKLADRVDHTANLLENLLNWARSQMDGMQVNPATVEFKDLVDEHMGLYQAQAEQKGIRLVNHISNPVEVYADREMVKLVLRNLLSNALKFTPTGGQISVEVIRAQRFLRVSVKDNGIGISPEAMPRLFSPATVSTYGTANEKGSGLGLLMSEDFIKKNGGKIWVESEVGKGSEFFFTLPLA